MKQLLANLNWTFVKAWWKRHWIDTCALIAGVILGFGLMYLINSLVNAIKNPSHVKELTPLDMANILTEKVNKQNAQIRQLKTELDQVKRQLAGELPQIHGGKTYEFSQQNSR